MANSIRSVFIVSLIVWLGGKILLMTAFSGNLTALNLSIVTDIAGVLAIVLGLVLLVRRLRGARA
jgi:hypothetical protein